jgi:HAD superfamily hydrolase (TIGR01509 family)
MDAVIFDCDGVLVDSEVIALRVELAALAEIGLHYERHAFAERFLGQTNATFHAGLNDDHQQQFGKPLPENFGDQLAARIWAEMAGNTDAVAGVHDVVKGITVAKAVASSSSAFRLEHKLRHAGLFDVFAPHVYSGELVPRGKPWPDLYLHTAAQLKVDPAACVAVEDSVNGVRSAVAAGMITIGFIGGGHCSPNLAALLRNAGAVHVANDMPHLLEILENQKL